MSPLLWKTYVECENINTHLPAVIFGHMDFFISILQRLRNARNVDKLLKLKIEYEEEIWTLPHFFRI